MEQGGLSEAEGCAPVGHEFKITNKRFKLVIKTRQLNTSK